MSRSPIRHAPIRALLLVLLAGTVLTTLVAHALEVPARYGPVNDHAHVLSEPERERLTGLLRLFRDRSEHTFAFLSIASLDGASLEEYSLRVATTWQLGRIRQDDGLLMLFVKNDHRLRIEVGRGLEGVLPDVIVARIERRMVEAIRRDDVPAAIDNGFRELMTAADPEAAQRATNDLQLGRVEHDSKALTSREASQRLFGKIARTPPVVWINMSLMLVVLSPFLFMWLALKLHRRKTGIQDQIFYARATPANSYSSSTTSSARDTGTSTSSSKDDDSGGTFAGGGASASW